MHWQHQEKGASLRQLKDEVRFQQAGELLHRTSQPVKKVAAAAGFGNEKSFTRAFRAWSGVSPGEFRKNLQG